LPCRYYAIIACYKVVYRPNIIKDNANVKQLKQHLQLTQKKFPGLGIGFYTSKEIIMNH